MALKICFSHGINTFTIVGRHAVAGEKMVWRSVGRCGENVGRTPTCGDSQFVVVVSGDDIRRAGRHLTASFSTVGGDVYGRMRAAGDVGGHTSAMDEFG